MNTAATETNASYWRISPASWILILLLGVALGVIFYSGFRDLVASWFNSDEYSYGMLIPLIVVFLIWQDRERFERLKFSGSVWGTLTVIAGVLFYFIGELSTLYIIVQYAFVVVLSGLMLSLMGWTGFRMVIAPLTIVFLMIPLPHFLFSALSTKLQLLSSALGVYVIRLFGISVFLSGNVIDLGSYKLQVVEACSGLRYLFPLITLAFIATCFFSAPLWKRALVVLSAFPITVLMNSFRIGMIGVMVEYWGTSMAEGFLHDFEGWAVFMACFAVLVLEMWALHKVGGDRRPFREVFGFVLPAPVPEGTPVNNRRLPVSFYVASAVVALALIPATTLPTRAEINPPRKDFASFPLNLEEWRGRRDQLEQKFVDQLKFDDYILADYQNPAHATVNLYVAFYESQRKGEAVHSPSVCLPASGWEMTGLRQSVVSGAQAAGGQDLVLNRAQIELGDTKQLVYYWFHQRGRLVTNEWMVKWWLFWDALTKNRSDGALVRLTTLVLPGEDWEAADARLTQFSKLIGPTLDAYLPN